ncbi:MAG: hypothetical protein M0R68_03075 [Bacteroidetes bacterium]|nr:hypothetical protein [Bacteroidota bacterium]
MGFFIMKLRNLTAVSLFFCVSTILFAQLRPEWTNVQKKSIGSGYYYGIGMSQVSTEEADTRAFIEFSRNVEVKVKSVFQREVSEQGKEFSDATTISTELISDVSLKGIAVIERHVDTTVNTFYSLIRYRKTEYDSLIQFQIEREVVLMKVRNKMVEEKRQEELRSQKVQNRLEEEKNKEELRAKQERLTIEQKRRQQQDQEEELLRKVYGEFLTSAPPEKVISFRNGEISNEESSLMLKGGLSPFQLNGVMYAVRTGMFEIGATALFWRKKFVQQEASLKIQVLPRVGEFTRTSLSVGAVQAVGLIADSGYQFKRSKYSIFVAGNVTMPGYSYSTFSFYGDKRKISIGITTFPFYEQFKNHFGFILEMNSILDKDFRNEKGNAFVVNGGVRLQANDTFSTQLVYEDYNRLELIFEFQF